MNRQCCSWRKWWHWDSKWYWDRIWVDWTNELKVDVNSTLGPMVLDFICVHRSRESRTAEEQDPHLLFYRSRELGDIICSYISWKLLSTKRGSPSDVVFCVLSRTWVKESFIRGRRPEDGWKKSERLLLEHDSNCEDESHLKTTIGFSANHPLSIMEIFWAASRGEQLTIRWNHVSCCNWRERDNWSIALIAH